ALDRVAKLGAAIEALARGGDLHREHLLLPRLVEDGLVVLWGYGTPLKCRFFSAPPSGAKGERDSGDTPETPPGALPLDPASKKPIPERGGNLSGVGFLVRPLRGRRERDSGDYLPPRQGPPETLPGALPLDPASKKPIPERGGEPCPGNR